MTDFWLWLSGVFKWSFGFFEHFGNEVNWILFLLCMVLFTYWCWVLVSRLGNNKDKHYHSKTEDGHNYYTEELYKNPSRK